MRALGIGRFERFQREAAGVSGDEGGFGIGFVGRVVGRDEDGLLADLEFAHAVHGRHRGEVILEMHVAVSEFDVNKLNLFRKIKSVDETMK